jgi:hypothetical protein
VGSTHQMTAMFRLLLAVLLGAGAVHSEHYRFRLFVADDGLNTSRKPCREIDFRGLIHHYVIDYGDSNKRNVTGGIAYAGA